MLYKIALFTHVLGAIGLFVGISIIFAGLFGMRRARTVEQFREWAGLARSIGKFIPVAALVVLIPGIYMVITVWHWQTAWADVALASVLVIFVLGPAGIGPRIEALRNAAWTAPGGFVPRSLRLQTLDPVLWTLVYIFIAIALGILLLMTSKPALVEAIIIIGVAIILGLVCALPIWRAQQTHGNISQHPEMIERP